MKNQLFIYIIYRKLYDMRRMHFYVLQTVGKGGGVGGHVTCFVHINNIVTTMLLSLPTGLLGTIVITMLYVKQPLVI